MKEQSEILERHKKMLEREYMQTSYLDQFPLEEYDLPSVTVVIPTFNRSPHPIKEDSNPLGWCLESLLAQRAGGLDQIVVVDDASKDHTEKEVAAFAQDNQVAMFFGSYKGELIATCLVIFWSGIGFYHQAASLPQHAKLSVPYLLQWNAILEAKKRGCKLYDFWGYVDPKKYPKHPWAGPTLFKMGFGGKPRLYAQTRDLPLDKKYWATYIFETMRRIKRHL